MKDREPTVRSRELGEGLRRVMEHSGFHASGIARALAWSPSRVSRILSGKRGGSSHDVAAFIAVCGVRGDERDRLMALSLDHRPNWVVHHDPAHPQWARMVADYEKHASTIGAYHVGAIPDLLRTNAYASAVLEAKPNVPEWDIPDRVAVLAARRRILDGGDAPDCAFVIHESVLHTPVGGAEVMSDQLHTLLRWSVRPTISIRIIPRAQAHTPA